MKLEKIISVAASVTVVALCAVQLRRRPHVTKRRVKISASPSATKPACPAGEKLCQFANANGICTNECVKDTAMCESPACRVCDPVGTAPNAACHRDSSACQWDCPICDPVGTAPHAGCQWSTTACEWECPVCDPPPPPEKQGCQWDPKACVWLCL